MGDGALAGDIGRPFADGLSARALLSSIRRHLAIVLAFTLSLCVAGALVGLGLPAFFQAEGDSHPVAAATHGRVSRTPGPYARSLCDSKPSRYLKITLGSRAGRPLPQSVGGA